MQILGLGRQTSLQSLLQLVEREYTETHGSPAILRLTSGEIEITGERVRTETPFESWTLRLPADDELLATLRKIQSAHEATCSLTESGDRTSFQCRRAPGDADETEQTNAFPALDELSEVLTWPEVWRVEGEDPQRERLSVERLFQSMRDLKASDIHLYPGAKPVFRVDNETCRALGFADVSRTQIEELVREIAPDSAWDEFRKSQQCSFNYRQVGLAYSRVSAFIKAGVPHCTIRYLPEHIPTFEELHIPRSTMEKLAAVHEGLVLVSGMTGSGKSTTVASLIDWINENRALHILTIEAPVEFVHHNKRSIISQRNVGTDSPTAIEAVHGALRHDPDVIFIGEMRNPDTIRAAIDAAGTGHLVISTFHANNAAEVPNRIVSFFDPAERDLVRLQLRDCLRCVISQRLVPRKESGRIPALEFLFKDTPQIDECILSGNSAGLRVAMQQSSSESSIFEQSLVTLVKEGLVNDELAADYATNRTIFEQMKLGTYAVPSLESMSSRSMHRPV